MKDLLADVLDANNLAPQVHELSLDDNNRLFANQTQQIILNIIIVAIVLITGALIVGLLFRILKRRSPKHDRRT